MIEKRKKVIIKILFSLLAILMLMIIKSTSSKAFTMGSLDINGGIGITAYPETYLFGEYYCADHSLHLARTEDGTKNTSPIVHYNRNYAPYYNEEILYSSYATYSVEQSIAAGYVAYNLGAGSNKQFQNVVWASGQWASHSGYVNNLSKYTGTTLSAVDALSERAQAWANFYYNILQPSGMKLIIDTKPTSEEELRVYVDQNSRAYTQGPYMINILNGSGGVITNNSTEYYNGSTLGNLVYNEILGLNSGCGYFQFCKLANASTVINYTDGSRDTYSNITILDAGGNVIKFPKPGEIFYIRIEVPESETRIVSGFEPHFEIKYYTKITGTSNMYKASALTYEINLEKNCELTDSTFNTASDNDRLTTFYTNKTIKELYDIGVKDEERLKNKLVDWILDDEYISGMRILGGFTALFQDTIDGNECNFNDVDDYYDYVISKYQEKERDKIVTVKRPAPQKGYAYVYEGDAYDTQGEAQDAADEVGEELGKEHCDDFIENNKWIYSWQNHLPIVIEMGAQVPNIVQPVIVVNASLPSGDLGTPGTPGTPPTPPGTIEVSPNVGLTSFNLITTDCTVELGGKVWVDVGATKESSLNGRLNTGGADTGDHMYGGMLVDLHLGDKDGKIIESTTTDSNGMYHFDKLNALEKYTVVFTFNGQLYQQTYYKDDLSGGFSNAQEIDRSGFNDRFDTIDSYPNNYNYNGWHIAYGKDVKLKDDGGNYISNGDGALTYIDAWNQFVNYAMNDKSYESAYNDLSNWLSSRGVGSTDRNGVIQFIKDCMISANTRKYPVYDQFVIENIENPASQPETETAAGQTWNSLYITKSDQSRNVDFGINERDTADLAIQKDVYKATVRVNGKTQTYMYNNKDSYVDENGNWDIPIRVADQAYSGLYNGATRYTREIRKSEYLYDGTIYDASEEETTGPDARDLRVYVTYRITVRNQSQTYDTDVNEIIDYFDASEFNFDAVLRGDTYTNNSYSDFQNSQVTSYIGDRNGNYVSPLTVKTTSSCGNGADIGHGYMSEGNTSSPIYLTGMGRLSKGGGMTFIYVTFEVKKSTDENGMDNRIQMDVNTNTGADKGVGKQNLAEINGYSTYYGSGEKVPDKLNGDNSISDKDVTGQQGGVIDIDSTVGNLTSQDLDSDGDLIITDNPLTNRTEDDTDKAPNIRLIFPANDDYERVARGYVYEDERNQASNQAMVGNGRYDEGETKINGVTVQLVELVQEVDANGIPTGNYLGEYIWNATTWNTNTRQWVNANSSSNSGSLRYYSGQGNSEENHTVSPIISGAGATAISGYTFGDDSTGEYAFKGMPAGDFIVRFIYGDTTQTVLTTEGGEGDEVVQLLKGDTANSNVNDASGYISKSGLNAKSYNGQDYKSTTYQSVRDGENVTAVPQTGSYNGVYGYGYDANGFNADKYNTQNYNYTESKQFPEGQTTLGTAGEAISNYVNTVDGTNKDINYYYNIAESQVQSGISDAKDVGNVRDATDAYGRGITGIDGEDTQTIVNGRSEVLTAGLKVASTDELAQGATTSVNKQIAMIKELMENTEMVAQTGVINTEVEWNTNITNGQSVGNSKDYVLDDIDLGLEERPVAQLQMNKEVSNVRITLQNGTILFDTNRSVTNMPYADHEGHHVTYNPADPNGRAYRLISVAIATNSTNVPELITTYMDEELMYGARIEVDYTFTVTNVGEVDYLDKQFYYTGTTNDTSASNISTTTANTVVDYITNNMQFLPTNSSNTTWSIRTVNELTSPSTNENNNYQDITNFDANNTAGGPTLVGNQTELINNKYYNTLNTYNTIVTNKTMGDTALYPEEAIVEADEEVTNPQSSVQTTMMLSTTLTPDSGEDTMVYNNLSEIVQVSNSQGRRLKWSVTGNQPMADQDRGTDEPARPEDEIYTKADLVTPKEIDADSSQEILILPPTGANRNYTLWIIVGVIALVIIAGGVILIRRYFKKK